MDQDDTHKSDQEREDHFQVIASQKMIRGMREEVTHMGVMVKEVRDALKGSDLAKDGGLVQRVIDLEISFEVLRTKVDGIKAKEQDFTKVMRWVWISLGVVATTLFTWALNHFFPPQFKK